MGERTCWYCRKPVKKGEGKLKLPAYLKYHPVAVAGRNDPYRRLYHKNCAELEEEEWKKGEQADDFEMPDIEETAT